MSIRNQRGLTLLELLVTITILGLLTGLSGPSFTAWLEDVDRRTSQQQLYRAFQLARMEAIRRHHAVTICAVDKARRCYGDWSQPLYVFSDPQRIRRIDSDDQIITVVQPPRRGTRRVGVGNRGYFQYDSLGMFRYTWGNVTYCPNSGEVQRAGQLIASEGGRVRFARDWNGDGVVQNAQGQSVRCGT